MENYHIFAVDLCVKSETCYFFIQTHKHDLFFTVFPYMRFNVIFNLSNTTFKNQKPSCKLQVSIRRYQWVQAADALYWGSLSRCLYISHPLLSEKENLSVEEIYQEIYWWPDHHDMGRKALSTLEVLHFISPFKQRITKYPREDPSH